MATRYLLSSQSAILASTMIVDMKESERSIVVETRVVNISRQVSRNPRKIFTMYDKDTEIVSVFTSPDENLEEPVTIRSSTNILGPATSRLFSDAGLRTIAACSSAEWAFLAGDNPPDISRSFLFFHPRHPAEKVTKNRVVWLESFDPTEQDSLSGLRTTKCFVKRHRKLVSGTMIRIFRFRKIAEGVPNPVVEYVTGLGVVYKVRQNFVDVLNGLPQPFAEVIQGLIVYENSRSTYNMDFLRNTFANDYLKEKSSHFLWSMLQWCACFGDLDVMDMISMELASRVNDKIRNGIAAVHMELGVEP